MLISSKKKFGFLIMFWLVGILLFFINYRPQNDLQVVFCDVGQGDAILIGDRDFQILIDAGPDDKVMQCLYDYMPLDDKKIEWVVLTHPDSDHLFGMQYVLSTYKVDNLLTTNLPKNTNDFYLFYQIVQKLSNEKKLKIIFPHTAQKWRLTKYLSFQIVSQHKNFLPSDIFSQNYQKEDLRTLINKNLPKNINYNNESIAINMLVDDKMFTFTGDIESEAELAIITSDLLIKTDVLKIAHHGSKSSSSIAFLHKTQPEYSIISVGQKNQFGHPHKATLENLQTIKSKILQTNIHGTIVFAKNYNHNWQIVYKQ